MDRIELQLKKLHGHWTSQEFAGCVRSKADMDYIRSRFEKCDKKVKMKLLLSFINMDTSLRVTLMHPLKGILKMGSTDTDEWVQIVAGLVDDKLFSDSVGSEIQIKCKETLSESAKRVVKHLLDQPVFDDEDMYQYFEPYIEDYFTTPEEESSNNHFKYTGPSDGPDFILREQKLIEAKLAQDKKKAGYVTLMHANPPSRSQSSATSRSASSLSSRSIAGVGVAARKTNNIKSISLDQIQKLKSKEVEQKKVRDDKKRKVTEDEESTKKVLKVTTDQTAGAAAPVEKDKKDIE